MCSVGTLFINYCQCLKKPVPQLSGSLLNPGLPQTRICKCQVKEDVFISYFRRARVALSKGMASKLGQAPSLWLTELGSSVWQERHLMDIWLTDYTVQLSPEEEKIKGDSVLIQDGQQRASPLDDG